VLIRDSRDASDGTAWRERSGARRAGHFLRAQSSDFGGLESAPQLLVSPAQRYAAGQKAQPPLTDSVSGFAWPDTPLGVIKTSSGYEFFGSDGGAHYRQLGNDHWVGNNKSGSFVTTVGTLDNPLGSGVPQDVSVSRNPDPPVNPNYSSYGYMGGGPVFQVPAGTPGAGNLIATYHAELPNDALYAALGVATSTDNGLHWTDLGEIIRLNQSYAPGLDGFEIGDGPLVLSPDGKYFYLHFPDWIANGTLHVGSSTNNVSVARASVFAVLNAAFGSSPPHTVTFEKFYHGTWDLQPAVGGASTDLVPQRRLLAISIFITTATFSAMCCSSPTTPILHMLNRSTASSGPLRLILARSVQSPRIPPPSDSATVRIFWGRASTYTLLTCPPMAADGRMAKCGGCR
jgi:hypothetical protein